MSTGMEGYAAQAGALQGQAQGLRAAVDSGQLVMDPEAADKLSQYYESKADDVLFEMGDVQIYLANGAYGDCNIGKAMETKMAAKIEDTDVGVFGILRTVERTLRDMAKTVQDAKREHEGIDEDNQRMMNRSV